MPDPAPVLAGAFLAACRERGLEPPPQLRLLTLAPGAVATVPVDDLGRHHQDLVTGDDRSVRGAWYTPRGVADDLVARVIDAASATVVDPACGGGVFLLAAADRLDALGADPAEVVTRQLHGADIDPVAVAVTEAQLWWWAAERGQPAVAGANLRVGDALVDVTFPPADAVVGNPPFLGQLRSRTAVDRERRATLRARWGDAVQPYTDAGWLFLLAAVAQTRPGGRVTMIQPQSVLAARDAGRVRDRIDAVARLDDCWIDDGTTFDAAVDVCAPVLTVLGPDAKAPHSGRWPDRLIEARGIPLVSLAGERTVGDVAHVHAGFRDEYYGLVDAVEEAEGRAASVERPRLVTSGSIDPLRVLDVPVRFGKRRWVHPVVAPSRSTGRATRWLEVQHGPKLLVASQTKVLEAAVDPDGSLVAGVPAVVVRPTDPDDLWHLAAALHAPAVSAWLLARSVGTGLSADAFRPTADLLAAIPLPVDARAWKQAAAIARDLGTDAGAGADDPAGWERFAVAADRAYGVDDPAVRDWWRSRRPVR